MMELEDLRHEKELQREEIQKLQGQLHTLKTEIQVRCCKWWKIQNDNVILMMTM